MSPKGDYGLGAFEFRLIRLLLAGSVGVSGGLGAARRACFGTTREMHTKFDGRHRLHAIWEGQFCCVAIITEA
jgi:hypothetical protein